MCLFRKKNLTSLLVFRLIIISQRQLYLFEHADQDFGTKVTLGWFGISVNHKGVGDFQPGRHLDIDPRRPAWRRKKWLCDYISQQPSDAGGGGGGGFLLYLTSWIWSALFWVYSDWRFHLVEGEQPGAGQYWYWPYRYRSCCCWPQHWNCEANTSLLNAAEVTHVVSDSKCVAKSGNQRLTIMTLHYIRSQNKLHAEKNMKARQFIARNVNWPQRSGSIKTILRKIYFAYK